MISILSTNMQFFFTNYEKTPSRNGLHIRVRVKVWACAKNYTGTQCSIFASLYHGRDSPALSLIYPGGDLNRVLGKVSQS